MLLHYFCEYYLILPLKFILNTISVLILQLHLFNLKEYNDVFRIYCLSSMSLSLYLLFPHPKEFLHFLSFRISLVMILWSHKVITMLSDDRLFLEFLFPEL